MNKYILAPETKFSWDNGKLIIEINDLKRYETNEERVVHLFQLLSSKPMTKNEALNSLNEKWPNFKLQELRVEFKNLMTKGIIVPLYYSHDEFFKILNEKRSGMDYLKYDDWGLTVTNCGKNDLSPGCLSCKDGSWICIFPGFTCNVACDFCPRLTADMIEKPPMDTNTLDLLLKTIDEKNEKITGISISGGEIFHHNYTISKEIIKQIKKRYPHMYLWAYTNGLAATADNMKELRDLGLDELRFNLAATNFDRGIINNVKYHAVKIFPWVTVEIPIYDKSFEALVSGGKLKELDEIGVKQLNLAEVRVPFPDPGNKGSISPVEKSFYSSEQLYEYSCMSFKVLSVVKSRLYTYDIFEYANQRNLGIRINDCSQEAKFLQITSRTVRGLEKISKDVDAFADY